MVWTKENLEKQLVAIRQQAPGIQATAMLEAGKAIGRVEGALQVLEQLAAQADAAPAPPVVAPHIAGEVAATETATDQ